MNFWNLTKAQFMLMSVFGTFILFKKQPFLSKLSTSEKYLGGVAVFFMTNHIYYQFAKYRMKVENPILFKALNENQEKIWQQYFDHYQKLDENTQYQNE